MRKPILQIGIAAVAALLMAMLSGCVGCSDKKSTKSKADTDYEQWLKYPRPLPKGNSKAFSTEPVEGITISAKENALDHDRTFKMTAVGERDMQELGKTFADIGIDLLAAWDIDAGMSAEEVMPGTYKVSLDLAKMGFPAELEGGLVAYRMVDGVPVRYNTRVENHVLTYESSQNSVMAVAIDQMKLALTRFRQNVPGAVTYIPSLVWDGTKRFFTKAFSLRRYAYYMSGDYTMSIPIDDKYGNFVLNVRLEDTEMSAKDCAMHLQLEQEYQKRVEQLHKIAAQETERRVQQYVDSAMKGHGGNWFERWITGRQQREEALKRISESEIFAQKFATDKQMGKILTNPAIDVPQSVKKVIEYVQDANKYLTTVEKLKPATYETVVNLATTKSLPLLPEKFAKILSAGVAAATDYYPQPTITFNGGLLYDGKKFSDTPHFAQSVRITLTHELFHARQTNYWTLTLLRDNKYAEATAAVLEEDAARYFYRNGRKLSVNPETEEGHSKYRWSDRRDKYFLATGIEGSGYSREKIEEGTKVFYGYVLADFIDYLREAKKKPVPVAVMMNQANVSGFGKPLRNSFGIKTDAAFDSLYTDFLIGQKRRLNIYRSFSDKQSDDYRVDVMSNVVSKDNYLFHVKPKSSVDHHVEAYAFDCNDPKLKFNAFVVSDEQGRNPAYRLYIWRTGMKEEASPAYVKDVDTYLSGFGVATRMSKYKSEAGYYLCIFFKPDKPAVVNVEGDTIKFRLDYPQQKLLEKGLLTGARITVTNAKGQKATMDVLASDLGKTHRMIIKGMSKKGGDMKMTFHWYCNADKKGTKRFLSPESDAVEFNVPVQQEKPKAKPGKDDGGNGDDYERGLIRDEIKDKYTSSGKGYWKLTRVREDKPQERWEGNYEYDVWTGGHGSYSYKSVWTADTWRDVSIDGHRNCKGETGTNTVKANEPKNHYFAGDKMEFNVRWTLSDNAFHPGMTVPYGMAYSCWINRSTRVRIDPTEDTKDYENQNALRGKGPNGGWPTSGYGHLFSTPLPEGHRGDSLILTEGPSVGRPRVYTIYKYEWVAP